MCYQTGQIYLLATQGGQAGADAVRPRHDPSRANGFLKNDFWPRFNANFFVPAPEAGSALVPLMGVDIQEIFCMQEMRTVQADNSVTYRGKTLQIPAHKHRCHFVRAKVRVQGIRIRAWRSSTFPAASRDTPAPARSWR